MLYLFFFFNDTATTEIYTLSLHDALPTSAFQRPEFSGELFGPGQPLDAARFFIVIPDALGHGKSSKPSEDRKSTRLNSSHSQISYAVFCLKKKNHHQSLALIR